MQLSGNVVTATLAIFKGQLHRQSYTRDFEGSYNLTAKLVNFDGSYVVT